MILLRIVIFVSASTITGAYLINACNWIYACGCQSWWAKAGAACNIHAIQGPHCPWCLDGGLGGYITFTLVLAAQGFWAFLPGVMTLTSRFLWSLAFFPIGAGVFGLLFGWVYGYWRF